MRNGEIEMGDFLFFVLIVGGVVAYVWPIVQGFQLDKRN